MSSSSHSQFHSACSSSSTIDQDEMIARRKFEQKRRFQQKQGNHCTDVDSLMRTMFTDLKLQPQTTNQNLPESKRKVLQCSELINKSTIDHCHSNQIDLSSTGAADWSKIAFDQQLNTIFHQHVEKPNISSVNLERSSIFDLSVEQKSCFSGVVYPSWCSQPIVVLPLVYQQVFEASCVQGLIQTPILYPILLLSGLRQDQLSQIWSQVNLKHPGTLIKEELFMALALIALAQNNNGQIFSNDRLYNLIEIPLPHFQIEQQQQQQQSSTTSSCFVSSPSSSLSVSTYQQEDFADFSTFGSFEENRDRSHENISTKFDEYHFEKIKSCETESIASFDLPMSTIITNHQNETSQKEASDNQSFSSSNNNEIVPAIDTQNVNSISSLEPSKIDFGQLSDDGSQIECHLSVWLRCFEKCYSILSTTNEIFSSIESPTLCIEVLQQGRTQDHIHHLHEIFHVQKRICTAAVRESTITVQLTTLWKQIVVLWTNLQSFFSHAQLHLLNDDDIDYSSLLFDDKSSYCSICLLSIVIVDQILPNSSSFNTASITFAGRFYHAPCANFYLNLVDDVLPSLRRSSS